MRCVNRLLGLNLGFLCGFCFLFGGQCCSFRGQLLGLVIGQANRRCTSTAQAPASVSQQRTAGHGVWLSTPIRFSRVGATSCRAPDLESLYYLAGTAERGRWCAQCVAVRLGVAHHFCVAMIGGNQALPPTSASASAYLCDALIQCFDGFDRCVIVAGMADHVAVGVVADDQIVLAATNRRAQAFGQLGCRHFGLQIVGGHVRAGD